MTRPNSTLEPDTENQAWLNVLWRHMVEREMENDDEDTLSGAPDRLEREPVSTDRGPRAGHCQQANPIH